MVKKIPLEIDLVNSVLASKREILDILMIQLENTEEPSKYDSHTFRITRERSIQPSIQSNTSSEKCGKRAFLQTSFTSFLSRLD